MQQSDFPIGKVEIIMNKAELASSAALGLFILMLTVSSAGAQRGARIHYSTLFNPQTVTVVSGEVSRVEQVLAGNGMDYCVHAVLNTPRGPVTAVLGPKGFMTKQGLTIARQDRVIVKGSLISIMNKPFILAMEVTGDRAMKLRETTGRPAWAVEEDWHAMR
jgi:hypothetical protein